MADAPNPPAARFHDPVAHSHAQAGFLAGAVAGVAVALGAALVIGVAAAAAGPVLAGALVGGGLIAAEATVAGIAVAPMVAGVAVTVGELAANVVVGGWLTKKGEEIGQAIGAKSMQAPSGKIIKGSPNVTINGLPASRVGDQESCDGGKIAQGSGTVFINGMPAARVGDKVTCGATIVGGSRNVFIGGATVTRLPVQSEVSEAARFAAVVIGILPALGGLARATASAFAEIKAAGFARAAQIGVKALGRAMEARGTPKPFAYSPKRLGETEPGAVPNNAKLQSEMDAAATARARKAEEYPKLTAPADEYPELPAAKAATFGDDVRPWNGDDHEGPIRRVIGSDRDANGGYWQAEIPSSEAEWRGGSAVLNDWNGNGGYVESSPKGLRGWIGSARPQMSSDGVNVLPGHGEQIWFPPGRADPGKTMPTPWSIK